MQLKSWILNRQFSVVIKALRYISYAHAIFIHALKAQGPPPAQRRHSNVKINDWTKRGSREGWKKMRNLKIATRRKMALIWLLGWRPVPFFVSVLIGFLPPALELLSFINIACAVDILDSPWLISLKYIHKFWIFATWVCIFKYIFKILNIYHEFVVLSSSKKNL